MKSDDVHLDRLCNRFYTAGALFTVLSWPVAYYFPLCAGVVCLAAFLCGGASGICHVLHEEYENDE